MTTLDTTTGSDPGEMPAFLKREPAEKQRHWRELIPVHRACAAFPDLSHDELLALGQDIKVNGLLSPIVIVMQEGRAEVLDVGWQESLSCAWSCPASTSSSAWETRVAHS